MSRRAETTRRIFVTPQNLLDTLAKVYILIVTRFWASFNTFFLFCFARKATFDTKDKNGATVVSMRTVDKKKYYRVRAWVCTATFDKAHLPTFTKKRLLQEAF